METKRLIANRGAVTGLVCIFLAALVWIAFGQTIGHEFVNYDDDTYVYANPKIIKGLTLDGIAWAFTHTHSGNWHPLTTISHMLDCQFYGLQPWGHHLTNVLLHMAAAIFLFLALRQLTGGPGRTGDIWRSGFVAAVFAIHPLRVESVAWVAERKDVLSGVFFMLTLWAYARYARGGHRAFSRYVLTLVLFALGLMCKPTLVTLPFVLLLLDYWPLGRFGQPGSAENPFAKVRLLILEKIPFLVLSVASCVATLLAQRGELGVVNKLSFPVRVGNALLSYVVYLGQMIYPARLAPFYPHPAGNLRVSEVLFALLLLLIISAACWVWRKNCPYVLMGWSWYLAMLVPMIGIVQVGLQARADRYTYLSQIGLYLLITWAAIDLSARWRHGRQTLIVVALIVITALMLSTRVQASYWRNSETLWSHSLENTSNNYIAHNNLGNALLQKGQTEEAAVHFQKALEIRADYPDAYNSLGNIFLQKGQMDQALVCFQKAIELKPDYAEAHNNLGNVLRRKGQVNEAVAHYQTALEIKPDYAAAQNNLGIASLQQGHVDEAIGHYERALEIQPGLAEVHNNLANAFRQQGKVTEAITHYVEALALKPSYADAHYNLGCALVQVARRDEAIMHLQEALRLQPGYEPAKQQLRALGVEVLE